MGWAARTANDGGGSSAGALARPSRSPSDEAGEVWHPEESRQPAAYAAHHTDYGERPQGVPEVFVGDMFLLTPQIAVAQVNVVALDQPEHDVAHACQYCGGHQQDVEASETVDERCLMGHATAVLNFPVSGDDAPSGVTLGSSVYAANHQHDDAEYGCRAQACTHILGRRVVDPKPGDHSHEAILTDRSKPLHNHDNSWCCSNSDKTNCIINSHYLPDNLINAECLQEIFSQQT